MTPLVLRQSGLRKSVSGQLWSGWIARARVAGVFVSDPATLGATSQAGGGTNSPGPLHSRPALPASRTPPHTTHHTRGGLKLLDLTEPSHHLSFTSLVDDHTTHDPLTFSFFALLARTSPIFNTAFLRSLPPSRISSASERLLRFPISPLCARLY